MKKSKASKRNITIFTIKDGRLLTPEGAKALRTHRGHAIVNAKRMNGVTKKSVEKLLRQRDEILYNTERDELDNMRQFIKATFKE